MTHPRPVIGTVLVSALALAAGLAASQTFTREDSASMQKKLDVIQARGAQPPGKSARPLRTSFTEREVNAYFKYGAQVHIPAGVVDPQVVIAGDGRLEGRAIVDLEAVKKSQPNALVSLLSLFTGSVEVKATGQLTTADGRGTFVLDRATVGGMPVPKSLLQTLVTHYSKTPEAPDGFDLDKPFDLPAAIRTVEMQRGTATIVQ